MAVRRVPLLALGLGALLALAALDGLLAAAAGSGEPRVVLWTLFPVPFVWSALALSPRVRHAGKVRGSSYLAVSAAATMLMTWGVGWVGAERAIHPSQCWNYPKLSDYPQLQRRAEEVVFESRDGTRLSGLFIPGEKRSAILLLHGFKCKREEMLPHADMLSRAGFPVLLFDFRGRGRSEGVDVTLGYYERSDVLGALDYLKARGDVAADSMGVLGISLGGATGILAATEALELRAVASESAFRSLNSAISQNFRGFLFLPAFPFAPITVWIAERRTGIRSEEISPEREVSAISPRPVMIMHGLSDRVIGSKDGQAIFAAAGEPKELWLIPGAGHAEGAKEAPAEYERRIVSFFEGYLK